MFSSASGNGEIHIDTLNFPKCENCKSMFYETQALLDVKRLDLPAATDISDIFYDCRQLKMVGVIEARNCRSADLAFYNTPSLKSLLVCNICGNASYNNIFMGSALFKIYGNGDALMARNRLLFGR